MSVTAAEFIAQARTWLGVPWHHQGRSRLGVDCAGLPECVLAELSALPETYRTRQNYGRRPTGELTETLERWCERVWVRAHPRDVPPAAPGLLVRMRFPGTEEGAHLAICTGPTIIHAYRPERRRGPRAERSGVVEHNYRTRWLDLTVSLWRAPGVRYE